MTSRIGDVPVPDSHFLGVYHVRAAARDLYRSSEESWWLTPVTCGPLGMLYTARLGSSKQTS